MKLFADTVDLEEIRELSNLGILDGVTTNPSLVAKRFAGTDNCTKAALYDHYLEICERVTDNVSLEVIAQDTEGIIREARELHALHPYKVLVKVPMTAAGLEAIKVLSGQGIRTNCTLVFSPLQALYAAKVGATYVSVFIGRVDDLSLDGTAFIENVRDLFDNYDLPTQILAASVRSVRDVSNAALVGIDALTAVPAVLHAAYRSPLTDAGLERFIADYTQTFGA